MQRNIPPVALSKILFGLFLLSSTLAAQQFPFCVPAAGNLNLRGEGLTEGVTITLSCSGATPGVAATAMVVVSTSVNITNHLSSNGVPDVAVAVTANGFLQPAPQSIQLVGNNSVNISGIQFTPGQDGGVTIKISNLRVDANSAANGGSPLITATLIANGLRLSTSQLQLGAVSSGLLSSQNTDIIFGSAAGLPATLNMASLFSAGTGFSTTRVTEGFASAFLTQAQDPNSDQGTRIMIQYQNLPASAELVVPDLIAGSSAVQPTSAGDLGLGQAAGVYASSAAGSLLLARVNNPNADGSGGAPFYRPPTGGAAQMTLSTATQLPINNGSAFVVYEVVDSNPNVQESAQIPTFVALTSNTSPGSYGGETISFAPVSTVAIADMTDPVPRFVAVTPPGDCGAVGDCNANYFPHLKLNTSQVTLQAPSGGTPAVGYLPFVNTGGGTLTWSLSVNYQNGSGWLTLTPMSGVGNATVGVHADPTNLTSGVYNATITVDAGPAAGSQTVPVVFTVNTAQPLITQVSNAADGFLSTLVPGSLASLFGTSLAGGNLSVTFDGVAATTTYNSPTQINLIVPASLAGKTSTQLVVSAGGQSSAPMTVSLANSAPAIFPSGVLNQDYSVNSATHPAASGSTLQIYLTGLPAVAGALVNIGNQTVQSVYSGPAPGVPGLQQVNVMLPPGLSGTTLLSVCPAAQGSACTPLYSVTIQ